MPSPNSNEIATKNSSKHQELPARVASLSLERTFTTEESLCLKRGHVPFDMDDKWFIYFDEPFLNFHRSWTGNCIYRLKLDELGTITEALVNRDPSQYKETDTQRDIDLLNFLIDNILLGKSTPFPLSRTGSRIAPGAEQHSFSGTGYPETPKKSWWQFWKV